MINPSQKYLIFFGIFNGGNLVFPLKPSSQMTLEEAETVAIILDAVIGNQLDGILQEGDYFAYDFADSHKLMQPKTH